MHFDRRLALACAALVAFAASAPASGVAALTKVQHHYRQPTMPQRFDVRLFAHGNAKLSKPDNVVVVGSSVYIGYQNATPADGSVPGAYSTIVQYRRDGSVVNSTNVLGRNDGLRYNPYTKTLWATVNEDANPALYVLNPGTLAQVGFYTFAAPPHGGGYDDLAFANGKAFIAASNPTLVGGINTKPAVGVVTLGGGVATVTPVLYGNQQALDTTTNTTVTLNIVDPDSLTVDPQGDVVLVDQAGMELVFLHNPGTGAQTVTRVPVGDALDDTQWATTSEGSLFIVDSALNAVYVAHTKFVPGTVFTEAPSDSGVASFIGTIDLKTGIVTPAIIGFGSPTGLLFVPER